MLSNPSVHMFTSVFNLRDSDYPRKLSALSLIAKEEGDFRLVTKIVRLSQTPMNLFSWDEKK